MSDMQPPPIDTELVEAIRYLINTHAWTGYYTPLLTTVRDSCIQQLLDPSRERVDKVPDDFLRGWVSALNGLLAWGPQIVDEHDARKAADEAAVFEGTRYEERAAVGSFGPLD